MENIRSAVGDVLRRARNARGLTLQGVTRGTGGRFKPSVLGGYERGDRMISLERFCELAEFYGVPADRLLGDALALLSPAGRREVTIDLTRLPLVNSDEAKAVAEFAHRVKTRRADYVSSVVTLRSGDVEALALECGEEPDGFLKRLRPALSERPT